MRVGKKFYLQYYHHTLDVSDEDIYIEAADLELHLSLLQHLADLGIVELYRGGITVRQAGRVKKIMRLRSQLGVNLPGAAIIMELLDRLESLQDELDRLKRR